MTNHGGHSDDPLRIGRLLGALRPDGAEPIAPAEATREVEGTQAAAEADSIDTITRALANGAIDAGEARARLIEHTVRAQLPANADPALVAEIRAEVEASLAADPLLESLLRPG
jgi:hypothetical protein